MGVLRRIFGWNKPKIESVPADQIASNDGLAPPRDPSFMTAMEDALKGARPAYLAAVPLSRISPYDPLFAPHTTVLGKAVFKDLKDALVRTGIRPVYLYTRGDALVLSDDYMTYIAARELDVPALPAFIIGQPQMDGLAQVSGPLSGDEVKRWLLGS